VDGQPEENIEFEVYLGEFALCLSLGWGIGLLLTPNLDSCWSYTIDFLLLRPLKLQFICIIASPGLLTVDILFLSLFKYIYYICTNTHTYMYIHVVWRI
jgi:hypothetical protein